MWFSSQQARWTNRFRQPAWGDGCVTVVGFVCLLLATSQAAAQVHVLEERMLHLRVSGTPEWSEFPQQPDAAALELEFEAQANDRQQTLSLRQQDVKQRWQVAIGDRALGRLTIDENDMRVYFEIPAGTLRSGTNRLRISQQQPEPPDDVRIGEVTLHERPLADVLGEAALEVYVEQAQPNAPLPARITLLDAHGALQTVAAQPDQTLAVRAGTVYTASGSALLKLPAGQYTILAGRGTEYSVAQQQVELKAGEQTTVRLTLDRQMPMPGYVACDPHIHTLSYSGHGDATILERVVTIAGEGIELPIAADHNVHVDLDPVARQLNVRQFFTPVIGNEVTTSVGHFNIFPVAAGAEVPDHRLTNWPDIFAAIYRTPGVKAVILNHGRDLHSSVRPLGPRWHQAAVGENVNQWQLQANAMEIINSGATQSDVLQLTRDWMALLNRGRMLTPVGASDSHDVARHFVGQGRTYIRCDDSDPAAINTDQAVANFVQGQVLVSYGLVAEMTVNDRYGSGERVPVLSGAADVKVRVFGPDWIGADSVQLYVNGSLLEERAIPAEASGRGGLKWETQWQLPPLPYDVHLVAITTGPGVDGLHWKTAKPYQPTSPQWQAQVWGCSGAVWLDGDGDGRKTPAHQYAQLVVHASGSDVANLVERLAGYDAAVAAQAAMLFHQQGGELLATETQQALRQAEAHVRSGFAAYTASWRQSQLRAADAVNGYPAQPLLVGWPAINGWSLINSLRPEFRLPSIRARRTAVAAT